MLIILFIIDNLLIDNNCVRMITENKLKMPK